jgi:hypothetical protein
MKIELQINRLVLDGVGFEPREAVGIREPFESELSRLLSASPSRSWQRSRRERSLNAPTCRQDGKSTLAHGIARSVYDAVSHAR